MIIDDNILIKYCDNELSEEEILFIETWASSSSDNQKLLERIYFTLEATKRLHVMNTVDTDKAFAHFKLKHKGQKRSLGFSWLLGFQKIAAILFIPLLIIVGYLYLQKDGDGKLQMVEINTNPGVISTYELPDGSKVWLNANSSLKYALTADAQKRIVELVGEGYFEVAKNPQKPFIVKVGRDYSIEVLGTSFNVSAYIDEDLIETTLLEGAVKLDMLLENNQISSLEMEPNQQAVYYKNEKAVVVSDVNPELNIDWTNGEIIFRQEPMIKVLKTLSRHYNVQFDVQNPDIYDAIITATFKDEQLVQVMEYLSVASGIKYTIQKSEINENMLKKSIVEIYK
ncbi:MAG: FecR family protein [Tannerella sp.]|jgi:ferric-dicitrate binding protein FerR (iron transport regulator)|nr:FecR family protein [Tannerella sp.]